MKKNRYIKNKKSYFYPAIFNYDNEEISVTFPDLDVATSGIDEQDALLSARELLETVLLGLKKDKEEIPIPSSLNTIKLKKGETITLIEKPRG